MIGLDPCLYGTHSLRRTKATLIYKKTNNLRAVQLPRLTMCDIKRDPGEKYCSMYPYLWTVTPFQNLVKSHMALIEKFPNRKPEVPEEAALTPHD